MKVVQFTAKNEVSLNEVADPSPGEGAVLVSLKAAALNHRDLWIKLGMYPGIEYPVTPGSDGAGVVEAVGANVAGVVAGDEVVINPGFDFGDDERAHGPDFTILGLPHPGTLAEKIVAPATQLASRPPHLGWTEAAALPLAGLTAYRALFSRARLQAGEKVLLTGIGGGVALFALQFAVAAGAEVWVTSSSAEKIGRAVELGAAGGFNYTEAGWAEKVGTAFDVIVDSAGGDGFAALVDLAAPGARIVFFGATRGDPPLPMRKVFWKNLNLLGTTMGSPSDWAAMTAMVAEHQITPVVSATFPMAEAAQAFDLMERGAQFGKIVVTP